MPPVESHHMAHSELYCTYLVILKIHNGSIRLFDSSYVSLSKTQPFKILCHDMDTRSTEGTQQNEGADIKVFVLDKQTTPTDKSLFQSQQLSGGCELGPDSDMAIFMTSPMDSSRKASYAIEIALGDGSGKEQCKKIGMAYIYLETRFSTQGTQRMQIMGSQNNIPVGQIQVEYLIVTNPHGYGVEAPIPKWLSNVNQLHAGHRGAGSGCRADLAGKPVVENTVESFNFAARHGADMCELDVMCTADGVPVVYHNYILDTRKPGTSQIDELTMDELKRLRDKSIHDENCTQHSRTNALDSQPESSQPFPTLEVVLRDVDKSCALNVELKWAQLLPNGKNEAIQYREINDYVDRVLDCMFKHDNGRPIMLSTLNADIAMLLRLKQTKYPVLFLTTGDSQRFNDPTTKSIKNAIHFAQAFDMAGVNPNVATLNEFLVRYAQNRGLLVYAWGKIESAQAINELRRYGINGVIYDKIDLIKPQY